MDKGHEFSDAFIGAFVDGQMGPEEIAQIRAHTASDEGFNQRVSELRKIRDLIRLAYRELPKTVQNRAIPSAKAAGLTK